ncbi:MAG: MlaA family lipoprotein [Moraxellaceae bacterium]
MVLRVSLWPALLLLPAMLAKAAEAPAEAAAATTPAVLVEAAAVSTAAAPTVPAEVVSAPAGKNPDPWEKFNRGTYRFNDVADRYVLKPVAKGYKAITPNVVRTGITNFFINLRSPLVVMNDLLQGKVKQAGSDTARFVVNSTVGIVGLFDVGARINLPLHDEDFGQTLGVWGVPSGPFLVIPFMGPSSIRDGVGIGVDAVANPRRRLLVDEVDWILFGVDMVNSRASLLDLEDIIQGDRYLFIRDLYLQRREYSIRDGQIEDDPFLDDSYEDESEAPATDAAPASSDEAPANEAAPDSEAKPASPESAPARPDQGTSEPEPAPVAVTEPTHESAPAGSTDGSGG